MNQKEKQRKEESRIRMQKMEEEVEAFTQKLQQEKAVFQQQIELEKEKLSAERSKLIEENALKEEQNKQKCLEKSLEQERAKTAAQKEEHQSQQNLRDLEEAKLRREEASQLSSSRRERILGWLKIAILSFLTAALLAACLIGLYYFYRWATETPFIKEIEKRVEVEKEVIPEECTQIRRNGKVYISCDGVKVDGTPTIGDSGVTSVPKLITE